MALGSYDLQIIVSALDKATGPLKTIGAKVKAEAGGMAKTLADGGKSGAAMREDLSKLGSAANQTGTQIAGMGAAIVGGLGLAVKAGMDFNAGMAEVSTLVDTTEVSMGNLEKGVRSLATETGQSAQTLTGGLYQAISAGVKAGEAVEFLGVAAKAAVGGVTDTKTAVDGMTTVMNAWGKEAKDATEIADSMFVAVKAGKTTFGELAGAYSYIAGTAKNAGLSIDETNAALAAMTTQGMPTQMAARSLNMALLSIIKPGKDAADTAAALGIELGETALKEKGLVGVMQDLESKTGGSVEQMAKLLGSSEAARAGMALAGAGGVKFAETLEAMGKKAGASGEAYDKMAASGAASMARLKASATEIALSIADVLEPAVTALAKGLKPVLDIMGWIVKTPIGKALTIGAAAFGVMATVAGGTLIVVGQVAGALRNVGEVARIISSGELAGLIGQVGKLGSAAKGVIPGLQGVGTAVSGMGSQMAGIAASAGPIALVIIAIAALAVELYYLKKKWDEAAKAGKEAGDNFKRAMAIEDEYAKKSNTEAQLAQQRKERENAKVTLGDRFWGAMTGGGRTGKDIARERVAMAQPIAIPKRAFGGPVSAGVPYMVGEMGPELFMPQSSGQIIPNDSLDPQIMPNKSLDPQGGGGSGLAGAHKKWAVARGMQSYGQTMQAAKSVMQTGKASMPIEGGVSTAGVRGGAAGKDSTITISLEPGLVADKAEQWVQTPSGERVLVRIIGKAMRQAVSAMAAPA